MGKALTSAKSRFLLSAVQSLSIGHRSKTQLNLPCWFPESERIDSVWNEFRFVFGEGDDLFLWIGGTEPVYDHTSHNCFHSSVCKRDSFELSVRRVCTCVWYHLAHSQKDHLLSDISLAPQIDIGWFSSERLLCQTSFPSVEHVGCKEFHFLYLVYILCVTESLFDKMS